MSSVRAQGPVSSIRRVVAAALLLVVLGAAGPALLLLGSRGSDGLASPAAASPLSQQDLCPERNNGFTNACLVEQPGEVLGFLSAADDVDAYVVQVPGLPAQMRALLTGLPSDYDLHMYDSSASLVNESVADGQTDDMVEVQFQAAGTYYLFVNSGRGDFNPGVPYKLQLDLVLPDLPDLSVAAPEPGAEPGVEPAPEPGPPPVALPVAVPPEPAGPPRVTRIYFSLDPDGNRRAETDRGVLRMSTGTIWTYYDYADILPPNRLRTYWLWEGSTDNVDNSDKPFFPRTPSGWIKADQLEVVDVSGTLTFIVEMNGVEIARRNLILEE